MSDEHARWLERIVHAAAQAAEDYRAKGDGESVELAQGLERLLESLAAREPQGGAGTTEGLADPG